MFHKITRADTYMYLDCRKKVCHPTASDNFKSSCLILVIFGTAIPE